MNKDWRAILRFAVAGLAITVVVVALQVVMVSSSPNYSLGAVIIVLCPASLLFMPWFVSFFEAAEVGRPFFLRFMVVCWAGKRRAVCGYWSGLRRMV
jgi:hypothetical protein